MKGQVTLFVVLGLVILILAGLGIFLLSNADTELDLRIQEADEIRTLIKSCLDDASKESILLAGQNGGWIRATLPELESTYEPTDSNFFYYQPGIIPYWYFVDKEGNARSLKPPLCKNSNCPINSFGALSVQEQIEQNTLINTVECANLEDYEGRVDVERGLPGILTDIGRETVIFTLKWPHKISKDGNTEEFEDILVTQQVRLADAYKLSELLANEERYSDTFSRQTLSLITLYNGLEEPIPPMASSDINLFGSNKVWVSESVKGIIANDILPLNELFQVRNTKNYAAITDSSDNSIFIEGVYSGFDIGMPLEYENTVQDLEANIIYPGAKPKISLNDGAAVVKGEKLIKGTAGVIINLLGIGFTRYTTNYDLSYPLVTKVKDPNAFGGEGYTFFSAFEVNIDNNQPSKQPFVEETEMLGRKKGDGISLYRLSENYVDFVVQSERGGAPIQDIGINYVCGETHNLGKTDSQGRLRVKLPACDLGGIVEAFHPDYSKYREFFDYDGEETEYVLKVWPIKTQEIKLTKQVIERFEEANLATEILGDLKALNPETDFAMIIFEGETEWPTVQVYSFGDSSSINAQVQTLTQHQNYTAPVIDNDRIENTELAEMTNTVDLVPGLYNISAFLMHTEPITMLEDDVCIFGFIACETRPTTTFDSWPKGGLKLINFRIDENRLYNDNVFNFVLEEITPPSEWDDFEIDPDDARILWTEENQNSDNNGLIIE